MKFTPQMLSKLKSDYSKVKMMSVVTPEYKRLKALIQSLPDSEKQKLIDADIKWLKNIAKMTMKEDSNTEITEEKFYVGYNKGRGQGKGVFKGVFSSYKEAKKEVDKLIKLFSGSHNMTAYYVVDKHGNPVLETNEDAGVGGIAFVLLVAAKYLLPRVIDGLGDTIDNIKDFINPPKYIKFIKQLENNREFNRQFIELIKKKGGLEKFAKDLYTKNRGELSELPELNKAIDKFTRDEKLDKDDAKMVKSKIIDSFVAAVYENYEKTLKMLKKKYPDMAKDIDEHLMGYNNDRGQGSVEFSASQLKKLHEEYTTIDRKGITEEVLVGIGNTLSDIPNNGLEQLSEAGIPILSQMAKIVLNAK